MSKKNKNKIEVLDVNVGINKSLDKEPLDVKLKSNNVFNENEDLVIEPENSVHNVTPISNINSIPISNNNSNENTSSSNNQNNSPASDSKSELSDNDEVEDSDDVEDIDDEDEEIDQDDLEEKEKEENNRDDDNQEDNNDKIEDENNSDRANEQRHENSDDLNNSTNNNDLDSNSLDNNPNDMGKQPNLNNDNLQNKGDIPSSKDLKNQLKNGNKAPNTPSGTNSTAGPSSLSQSGSSAAPQASGGTASGGTASATGAGVSKAAAGVSTAGAGGAAGGVAAGGAGGAAGAGGTAAAGGGAAVGGFALVALIVIIIIIIIFIIVMIVLAYVGANQVMDAYPPGSNEHWWPIGSKDPDSYGRYSGDPMFTYVNSPFGVWRDLDGDGFKENYHRGIDVATAGLQGVVPLIATKDGVVISVQTGCVVGFKSCGGGYGNSVFIDHGDGEETRHAHMYDVDVSVGDEVSQGQKLGTVGTTGNSSGPHLHFEVLINGTRVQPLDFVSPENPRPMGTDSEEVEDLSGTIEINTLPR